jgi:hypothetical protein
LSLFTEPARRCAREELKAALAAFAADGCRAEKRPAEAGRRRRLRIGVADLLVRLLGFPVIHRRRLALLARFLTAALLLSGLLTRGLFLLARLVLIGHGCFLSSEHQHNGSESGIVPTKEKRHGALPTGRNR